LRTHFKREHRYEETRAARGSGGTD
jgi:hypothetical protein